MSAPVSRVQRHMWFGEQVAENPVGHLIPIHLRLMGAIDETALGDALRDIVGRHTALRTSMGMSADGEPAAVLRPASAFELDVVQVGAAALDAAGGLDGLRLSEATAPLDLAAGIPFRARLLRLPDATAVLCLTVHHTAFDDWSRYLLFDELSELYESRRAGRPASLPPASGYAQYAQRRDRELAEDADRLLGFWRLRLAGLTPFELTADRPRPARRAGVGAATVFGVPASVMAGLAEIGRDAGASTNMVLFAAVQALLRRWSGRDDITVGTTWAERAEPDARHVVGPLLNLLALRCDTAGNPSFAELVARTRDVCLDAFDHCEAPFGWLAEQLGVPRDASRTPLFQVLVGAGSGTRRAPILAGVEVEEMPVTWTTSKYDLSVWFENHADGSADCEVVWDTALYPAEYMERLASHLRSILAEVASRSQTRISELRMVDADEFSALTVDYAAGTAVAATASTLHGPFEAQAARTPDAVAVVAPDATTVTYADLDAAANQLAWLLRQRGVGPEVRVGICAERSVELVVALLAVLKAGGAFVPLDPDYPADRLAFMLHDAAPPVVLVQQRFRDLIASSDPGMSVVPLDDASAWADLPPEPLTPTPPVVADNAAYVIYTSGSTGRPKGVVNAHRGIVNRLEWMRGTHPLGPDDAVLQKTPTSFDVSVWEFFWPLWTGARLVLARPGGHKDAEYLRDVISAQRITATQFVPSMLAAFLTLPDIERCAGLRDVFCSGEELPLASVTAFLARLPHCRIHDLYGPTEAAIEVTAFTCDPAAVAALPAIPIGGPIDNVRMYVLDEWLNPVPAGAVGDLYIGGVAVARGYHLRPGLTADRFIPDPHGTPGSRMYRTGDLARWRPMPGPRPAVIDFLGRVDRQVKLNGVRVEPGEIEHALRRQPGVTEAVVVVRETAPGDQRLIAYASGGADGAALRRALRDLLPAAMVPAAVVMLPALPVGPSGKIDRARLPEPSLGPTAGGVARVAPRNAVEEAVAEVWAEVLGVGEVGVDDDFFVLGGHSLLLIRAANRLRDLFDLDVPLSLLFENPTVAGAAAGVERLAAALV
ncbi:amino acid adenylation domain-containing protein [Parafrankia irregularis]|uniref:Amino acid adenylation domain-containing protein n=1 Tax=Parafrankia irregularis TaxID=795642 RepID=A0A0S4QVW9_9ACTN|nr:MULTISPECIES: non-ribosomal peptide synthetase [Parafrankia]MBE3205761.1 non-ribosomal peptide synthetase [Parafrankia sp. CH37]CUU59635.1 amino acid adenylation domain-containing protein [Parafrankia irregularis]